MARFACVAAVVALALGPVAVAGDLAPPGPPGPTMRTLEEIEPRIPVGPLTTPGDAESVYRIANPGSYYLTADVVGEAFKHGVVIDAPDVSLDLNGFALRGVAGSLAGVRAKGNFSVTGARVFNGVIRGWGADGVDFDSWPALDMERAVLRDLQLVANGGSGVAAGTWDALIERCTARHNGGAGIAAGSRSIVRDCIARNNQSGGVLVGDGSIVERCIAVGNTGVGIDASFSSTVTNCTADFNAGGGIAVFTNSVVTFCGAFANTQFGIKLGSGSNAFDCVVTSTTQFSGAGILANFANIVARCTVRDGAGDGIQAGENAIVRDCVVHNNFNNGIYALGGSQIIDNTSSLNGIGILLPGGQLSRVEGNSTHRNRGYGIRVTGDSNFVIRNYALLNDILNYEVAPGNMFGTVVGDVATMTAAPNTSFNVGN